MYTLNDLLKLAEESKVPNTNQSYVEYKYNDTKTVVKACFTGAIALQINRNWGDVVHKLGSIFPDKDFEFEGRDYSLYTSLQEFINDVNDNPKRGRKRVAKLIRKHFSNSLDKKIAI